MTWVVWWHGYLETYLYWMTVEIFYLGVDVMMFYSVAMFWKKLLFMHAWCFIEEVTSRFIICRIISVIYRFKSLGCYTKTYWKWLKYMLRITKDDLSLRVERNSSWKLLVPTFLFNCSSSKREIMNEECNILGKVSTWTWAKNMGFPPQKVTKLWIFPQATGRLTPCSRRMWVMVQSPRTPFCAPGACQFVLGTKMHVSLSFWVFSYM